MDDEFICLNCNSKEILDQKFVSIDKPNSNDPWSSVTQIIKCAECKKDIPTHLGERWDNISIEQAKIEFIKYK